MAARMFRPGIHGPPGPVTDQSELVLDFQKFVRPGPVHDLKKMFWSYLVRGPDRTARFATDRFRFVDPWFRQICFHIFRSTDMCTSTFYWWFGLGRFQNSDSYFHWLLKSNALIGLTRHPFENIERRIFPGLDWIHSIPYLFGSFSEEIFALAHSKDTSKVKNQ